MESIDLTGVWHFLPDPIGEGENCGYFEREYDNSLWREVRVPSDFDTSHPSLQAYEGGAWYRKKVTVPASWQDKRIVMHIEGANARMKVWVNGHFAGAGNMPYLPFEFEIQDFCVPGPGIVIAVWVDNTRLPGEVPGMQRGWRTFGGILRDIILQTTDLIFIDSITTNAEPGDTGGTLSVRASIQNKHKNHRKPVLLVSLFDQSGRLWEQVSHKTGEISPGTTSVVASDIAVPGAHLWSPEVPNLYTLELTLTEAGHIIQTKSLRVGFRRIEVQQDKLLLNGVPIYLTGFNRHEDSIAHNMCVDLETARTDFEAMKDAGANFVRLCHYPHDPGEVDLCDEMGLLVMDEIPLYWWDGLAEGEDACAHKLQAAEEQLVALIRRDRNHPSVIFWSVSNETEEHRPEVVVGNDALVVLAQKLDPTRLVVHVSNHWQDQPHFEHDDVICVNAYPTWWEKIMQRNTPYTAMDGGHNWRRNLEVLHQRYPDKPILVTEFGYVSFPGIYEGTTGEKAHAEVIAGEFAGIQAPFMCGATVWCWADHPWPAATFQFANYLGFSPYGILARNRRKKRPFWIIRQLFREKQDILDQPKHSSGAPYPAGQGIYMVRYHMDNIPQHPFPEGYGIRPMRLDEGGLWSDIWRDAASESDFSDQLYHSEFGHNYQATTWRSFIVTDPDDLAVGIISAWYNQQFQGGLWGQIHWVALRQRVWGKGLGKAMMTHAMNYLAEWHDRAYLGTQTNRLAAIKHYLDFGFLPFLDAPGAEDAWRSVAARFPHRTFSDMGLS